MEKKDKIPQIRFAGFNEPWEQRKLGEYADIFDGVHQTPDYTDSGIMFLSVENIETLYSKKFVSEQFFQSNYKIYPQKGDILMTRIGSVGIPNVVKTNEKIAYYVSLALIKPKKIIDTNFLCNEIKSTFFQIGLRHRTLLTAIPQKINKDEIGNVSIIFPNDIFEQVRIGEINNKIDNLITLHQRKLEKLKTLKKSLLEKMFPKSGYTVPEIRFKNFTDPWEQRKLQDEVEIIMGQSPAGSTYSNIPCENILVQGNADLKNGWVNPRIWTSQVTKKANKGDLIISVRAPAGEIGKTAYDVVLGRGVAAIKGNEFIYQILFKMNKDGYWKRLSCGSTFESINSNNIKLAEIKISSLLEQNKIGSFFSKVDNLITLHQRQFEKLNNIKKSLLEKMFV